jgi:glutamyl-tRNA reductase
MFISVLSVNHKIAPVEVREKLAFAEKSLNNALNSLTNLPNVNAGVILSTCNRLEIYISSSDENTQNILVDFLANYHATTKNHIEEYLDYFNGESAITHICEVASGLDSLVMGEPQILGQLKDSYNTSKQNKTLDTTLEKFFQHAFLVAKKVRTDTEIGKNPVSVAYCGVKLAEKIFSDFSKQTAILIGAGEMIELAAQHLKNKNIGNIIIANRTKANAEKLTKTYGGTAIGLGSLAENIHKGDIIITSTAAPIPIIGKGMIEASIKKRKHKPIFILDIAVPRDVESQVSELADAYLYTVDDLKSVIDENINSRNQAKIIAQNIIKKQNQIFLNYLESIPKHNLIRNYKNNADEIKNQELTKVLAKLSNEADKLLIAKFADQLTNKLLHKNFINIKQVDNKQVDNCKNCIPKKQQTNE